MFRSARHRSPIAHNVGFAASWRVPCPASSPPTTLDAASTTCSVASPLRHGLVVRIFRYSIATTASRRGHQAKTTSARSITTSSTGRTIRFRSTTSITRSKSSTSTRTTSAAAVGPSKPRLLRSDRRCASLIERKGPVPRAVGSGNLSLSTFRCGVADDQRINRTCGAITPDQKMGRSSSARHASAESRTHKSRSSRHI